MIGRSMTEQLRRRERPSETLVPAVSPAETVSYIKDLLGSLRDMAECQRHARLAELLELAQKEAELVSRQLARV
jgi:hypothetical protein